MIDCTTIDASIASGDFCIIQQRIEGYNFHVVAQREFTLSFWVKATKPGIYCISVSNSGADRSFVAEYTIDVADTWEYKTITVSASPSAGTWDYTNGSGLHVNFTLAAGTSLHTTAGVWQTGDFLATVNQVNACDNVANNFRLSMVKIEPGSTATEFVPRSIALTTELCKRYFEKFGGDTTFTWLASGFAFATDDAIARVIYIEKRALPSISVSAAADFTALNNSASVLGDAAGTTINNIQTKTCNFQIDTLSGGGLVQGDGTIILINKSSGRFNIDAEL